MDETDEEEQIEWERCGIGTLTGTAAGTAPATGVIVVTDFFGFVCFWESLLQLCGLKGYC